MTNWLLSFSGSTWLYGFGKLGPFLWFGLRPEFDELAYAFCQLRLNWQVFRSQNIIIVDLHLRHYNWSLFYFKAKLSPTLFLHQGLQSQKYLWSCHFGRSFIKVFGKKAITFPQPAKMLDLMSIITKNYLGDPVMSKQKHVYCQPNCLIPGP